MASVKELGLVGAVPTRPVAGSFHLYVLSTDSSRYLQTNSAEIKLSSLGDMAVAVYDPAAIAEQLVGLIASQTLSNKTLALTLMSGDLNFQSANKIVNATFVNGVALTAAGAATNFLNEAGGYTVPLTGITVNDYYQSFDNVGGTDANQVAAINIPFDVTEQGQSWITDTSNNVKTINTTGKYRLAYSVGVNKNTASACTLEMDIYINGTKTNDFVSAQEIEGNDFATFGCIPRVIALTATDTIEVKSFRLKGSPANAIVIPDETRLTIFRIS